VNFSLYSHHAESVELVLFAGKRGKEIGRTIALDPREHRTGNYWHVFVPGLRSGQIYGYHVDGPFEPERGLWFDRTKLLLDPYAKAVIDDGYDRLAAGRRGEPNVEQAMKGVVVDQTAYDWEGDRPLGLPYRGGAIYEMHVRGFTAHPSSQVRPKWRGTYAGLVEKIPYLQDLGVEMIELLPVFQFDPQSASDGRPNYWGYEPLGFFAPHRAYSSARSAAGPVDEFRDMVKALHRAGIEVILDVVFNHTAEDGADGPTVSMRGIDNPTYYLLDRTDRSRYVDDSGVGNTLDANHSIVRRLIIDSLRYWVQDMHVDGFRFDLASVLSRGEDNEPLDDPPILWDIDTDPVLAGTKIIAEAWDAAGLYQVGSFAGDRWAVWNGPYRDVVRRFVKGGDTTVVGFADAVAGSPNVFGDPDRDPMRNINFVVAHDGFTLNDLVSYDGKHNDANGEQNRDGSDQNDSWNCGTEGPTDDAEVEALRSRQIRNFFVILLLSQGCPMFTMGDEVRRTQHGNNNAYCQDNEISWFDWRLVDEQPDLLGFVRALLRFRAASPFFADERFWAQPGGTDIRWHGVEPGRPDWGDTSHSIAFELLSPDGDHRAYVAVNAYWEPLEFTLPRLPDGLGWSLAVDTHAPSMIGATERRAVGVDEPLRVADRSVACLVTDQR
jgi:glycogen operon protein